MSKQTKEKAYRENKIPKRKFGFWSSASGIFTITAIVVLVITSVIWSYYSARVHMNNADQLVSPYLFENSATFRGAVFPTTHTFLLKWPLFWLLARLQYSQGAFIAITVVSVLTTLGTLLLLVRYLGKKNSQAVGVIAFALAAILLFVPIQPYPGALLPVNLAMLTTRNIEYTWFIAALLLCLQARTWVHWRRWVGVGLLSVLIASDRLFIPLSLGAVLVLAVVQLIRGLFVGRQDRWLRLKTLAGWSSWSLLASVAGILLVKALNVVHVSQFSSASVSTSPYAVATGLTTIVKGGVFAVLSIATNFGANPFFDLATMHDFGQVFAHRLTAPTIVGYAVNGALAIIMVVVMVQVWRAWQRTELRSPKNDLAVYLLGALVAAVSVFALSNHYFPVDARYLGISLFAAIVGTVVLLAKQRFAIRSLGLYGVVMIAVCGLGLNAFTHNYRQSTGAQQILVDRNRTVAELLKSHPVDTVLGDYWRVLPLKHEAKVAVTPMDGCTTERGVLSSQAWRPDLTRHSFAYLLTLDKGLTDFPQCKLDQITNAYGQPNSSVVVDGNVEAPKEAVLFYDRGIRSSNNSGVLLNQSASTLLPQLVASQPAVTCPDGKPTIMNVVAHQDDDLLFQSPDLLHDIKAGNCVRTVYVTAGDAGGNRFYWLERETGSKAAYLQMLQKPNDSWYETVMTIGKNQHITIATPQNSSNVSLAFLRLPDGNTRGSGFAGSHFESLDKLEKGILPTIHAVDDQSDYSYESLQNALQALFKLFGPSEVRTQAYRNANEQYPDHSDHRAVGTLVRSSLAKNNIAIKYYVGYPVHAWQPNVSNDDLSAKSAAFFAYAQHDPGVCRDLMSCRQQGVYGFYLERQYELTNDPVD